MTDLEQFKYGFHQQPGSKNSNLNASRRYAATSVKELLPPVDKYDGLIFTETDTSVNVEVDWSRVDLKTGDRILSDGMCINPFDRRPRFSYFCPNSYKLEQFPNLSELVDRDEYADICITEVLMCPSRTIEYVKFELLEQCECEFIVCLLLHTPFIFIKYINSMKLSKELYCKVFEIEMKMRGHYLELLNPEMCSESNEISRELNSNELNLYYKFCLRAIKFSKNNFVYVQEKYLGEEQYKEIQNVYLHKCI
jgi:hypothetical protein